MNIKELMESGSNVSVTMNLADLKERSVFPMERRSEAAHTIPGNRELPYAGRNSIHVGM